MDRKEKRKEWDKRYREKNRRKINEYSKKYYHEHKDYFKEKNKKWKEENREKWNEYQLKKYHERKGIDKNPDLC